MSTSALKIVRADLSRPEHRDAVVELTNAYAQDAMGDGKPLAPEVRARLPGALAAHPTTVILLAYDDDAPVGIATSFLGFSTFAARPLLNLHDLGVLPAWRGRGVGRALLAALEVEARALGCCKLTLEVLENNHRARGVYAAAGFTQATYQEAAGAALFMTKAI